MLDALAQGLRECRGKPVVGAQLQLDPFLDAMLRSRISRRVLAEHHINLASARPGFVGVVCRDLSLRDAAVFAAQRCKQVLTLTTPLQCHGAFGNRCVMQLSICEVV